jgi:capsular exopolysaccharide synthesis family protein
MMPQEAGPPDPANPQPSGRPEPNPIAGRIDIPQPPRDFGAPPGLSGSPDARNLLQALRRRWMSAVALGGTLAGITAIAVWFLMAPEPTAFAQFRVSSVQPNITGDNPANQIAFPTYMKTLAAQLKSRPVIMKALERDEVKRLNLEAQYTDPALYLEEKLKTEFQEGNEMLTLQLSGGEPSDALTIVKAIKAAFMDQVVYSDQRAKTQRLAELENIYNETNDGLKTKTANLERLAKQTGTSVKEALTQQQLQLLENLRSAKDQRNAVRIDLLKTKANLAALDARVAVMQDLPVSEAEVEAKLKADTEASATRVTIAKLKEVDQHFRDNHVDPTWPTWVAAQRKLKALNEEINERKESIRAELKNQRDSQNNNDIKLTRAGYQKAIEELEKEEKKLDVVVAGLAQEADRIGNTNNEMEFLRGDIRNDTAMRDNIATQLNRLKMDLHSPPRIAVYQDAELQKKDIRKQVLATVAAPIVVWLAVCMCLAWLEYRQRKIHTAGEVASGLGIRVVGAIPRLPNLERQLIGGDADVDGHTALESIDAIRTLLLHDAASQGTRVVMVTSAVEGEGKTTLAAHLAGSLARAGRKTLLVDADLRQPAVHQLFELPLQPGFSEVLLGEVEVVDSVQATTLDGLSVITAGQWDREVILSLARDGVEGIFERLREEFDFIIVDSHPVLSATDSLLVGQQADAVLLSVMRQLSQMPRVYGAAQRLTALKIRVLGAVVNGADAEEVVPTVEPMGAMLEQR